MKNKRRFETLLQGWLYIIVFILGILRIYRGYIEIGITVLVLDILLFALVSRLPSDKK